MAMRPLSLDRASKCYPLLMETVSRILATTSEISLKGGNRRWFERTLTDNVRNALSDLPVASIARPIVGESRSPWRVLGAMMAVEHTGHTMDDLRAHLGPRLENLTPSSFAIRCQRSEKRFPMTSPEIERG